MTIKKVGITTGLKKATIGVINAGQTLATAVVPVGATAVAYKNGVAAGDANVTDAGVASFTFPSAVVSNDLVYFKYTLIANTPAIVVGLPGTYFVLNPLVLTATTFPVGLGAGGIIAGITGKTKGSTLTLTPTDSRLALSSDGTKLIVGVGTVAVGNTINTSIRETLGNTTKDTPISIGVVSNNSVTPHPPAYANLVSSTDNVGVPPWYVGAGQPTINGLNVVVAAGDPRALVIYQEIPVLAGKSYVAEGMFDKATNSGGGLPRITFFKVGDSSSTYSTASLTNVGTRYHSYSVYNATADGTVRYVIEAPTAPSGSDNGGNFTFFNIAAGQGTSPSYSALDVPYSGVSGDAAFAQILKSFNFPTDLPPSDQSATPAFGTLSNNAKGQNLNCISLDYRKDVGNCGTRELIDAYHYEHHITGDHSSSDATTGDHANPTTGASYALIGRWPKGHQFDNIVPTADGVKLGVVNKPSDGTTYKYGVPRAAYLRLEQNILPGSYTEVTFIGPRNKFAWTPIWLYNGRQTSFRRVNKALGMNLTQTYGPTNIGGTDYYLLDYGSGYKEIDNLDMFFQDPGPGRVLTSGLVWKNGNDGLPQTVVSPYRSFVAADNGFTTSPSGLACLPAGSEWFQGPNTLGVYLSDDGTNLIQYIWNGRVFQEEYYEFYGPDLADPLPPHNHEPTGFHLILGGQFAARFQPTPDGSQTLENAGLPPISLPGVNPDDLGFTVKTVKHWRAKYTPVSRGANFIQTAFNNLSVDSQPTAVGVFTAPVTGLTAGSTVVVKSSNGADTNMSVSNGTLSINIADTAARTITITEHPTSIQNPRNFVYGAARSTSVVLQVGSLGTLKTLTLNTNESPQGLKFMAKVVGRTNGSTLAATITPAGGSATALSVNGDIIYSTSPISALGNAAINITETLTGAGGSPKTTPTITVAIKKNLVTSQDFAASKTDTATITNNAGAAPDGTNTAALCVLSSGGGIQIDATNNTGTVQSGIFSCWIKTADNVNQTIRHYNGATADFYTFDNAATDHHFPKGVWVKISDSQSWKDFRIYQQETSPNFYIWGAAVTVTA